MGPTPEEAEHARLILLWGTNTLTSNPHLWPALRRAREAGAKLVAIDPIRTRTAAQCDLHLPICPGTDAALALGMMHLIFRNGLEDRDYLERHTVGWEMLRERVREWTPGRTAEVTGLEVEQIMDLAHQYGTIRPSFVRVNYGMQRHAGGGMAIRTVSLLPAVVGAWRDVGGGATLSTSGAFRANRAALERPDWIPTGTRTINMIRLGDALTLDDAGVGGPPVKAMVVYNSNPAAVAPDLGKVKAVSAATICLPWCWSTSRPIRRITPIAVLPATTQLEHWDVHTSYGHLYVTLNRPSIARVGDSLPNSEIFRRLAARMGMDDPAFADSDLELIRQALDTDHPHMQGITLERLLEESYVRLNVPRPFAPYADPERFNTPSGKIQIHAPELEKLGLDPLPGYTPPAESGETAPDHARRFPLMLLSPPEHQFLNSTFVNIPSLNKAAGRAQAAAAPERGSGARHPGWGPGAGVERPR